MYVLKQKYRTTAMRPKISGVEYECLDVDDRQFYIDEKLNDLQELDTFFKNVKDSDMDEEVFGDNSEDFISAAIDMGELLFEILNNDSSDSGSSFDGFDGGDTGGAGAGGDW